MSSEQRDIRPYVGAQGLEHAMTRLRLRVASSVLGDNGRATLPTSSFLTEAVDLELAEQERDAKAVRKAILRGVDDLGLDQQDVELIVVASSRRLKVQEVVARIPVATLTIEPISVARGASRPTALQAPFGGCVIDAYLALARRLPPAPLRPWRAGTWLAHARFTIVTEFGEVGFTPFPLDEAARVRLQLPDAATRFVEVDSALDPNSDFDSIRLYVDPELLTAITAAPYSLGAKVLQRQLYLDVLAAVVMADDVRDAAADPPVYDAIGGSLLARVVDRVAGVQPSGTVTDSALVTLRNALLRDAFSRPTRFLALAESTVPDFKKALESSIVGGS